MKEFLLKTLLLNSINVIVSEYSDQLDKSQQVPKFNILTSDQPRSVLTARRLNYNWNDLLGLTLSKPNSSLAVIEIATGYPDYSPPQYMLDALVEVAQNQTELDSWTIHQYSRSQGDPALVRAIAKFFSMLMRRNIDPDREVIVTVGAQQALNAAIRAYLDPGEECIMFEPAYLLYEPLIRLSNAVPVYVPLRPRNGTTGRYSQDWTFDCEELERSINSRTKMILLNNPNNPYGKVYTMEELTFIGQMATKYNLVIVSDEVEQFYIYDEPQHIRIATLPGLYKRTITITSGGKLFSNTGWRVGWAIGPQDLLWGLGVVVGTEVASVSTPMQLALAKGLETEYMLFNTGNSFFRWVRDASRQTRNELVAIFRSIGADVVIPAAGYSVVANFARLSDQIDFSQETDMRPGLRMVNWLRSNAKIDSLAVSTFLSPKNYWKSEYFLRFVLIKSEALINELGRRLTRLFRRVGDKDYEKILSDKYQMSPDYIGQYYL